MSIGLRTRIFGGFAAVLALIAALGAITVTALRSIESDLGERARASAAAEAVRGIDQATLVARNTVETWLRTGGTQLISAVNGRLERIRQDLVALAERPEMAAQRQVIEDATQALASYRQSWQEVQNLTRTLDRVWRSAIEDRGARIANDLRLVRDMVSGQSGANAAMESLNRSYDEFIVGRLQLARYRALSDPQAHAAAMEALETALREIDKVQLFLPDQSQIERIEQAMAAIGQFRDQAAETKTLTERRIELAGSFARNGAAIASAVETMRSAFEADSTRAETAAAANITWANQAVLVAVAGVLALGVLMGWLIGRSIARPLASITGAMEAIAGGALERDIPALARKDEVGAMARALAVFRDGLSRAKALEAEGAAERERAEAEKRAAMLKLADGFEESVGGVVKGVASAAGDMQASAQSLSATAEETSRQAGAVAAASEQATVSVQTVASAAEELNASIGEIGRQASSSAQIAGRAVTEAERTNQTIRGLAEAAQKIGDVLKLISDIAGQTNLLALNATIEAARAGEAGKGFAVVASEVKSLATQTAKATEDIAAQIASIQNATGGAVKAIESIGRTIGELDNTATAIAAAVEQQGAATREIARNVGQAAQGTTEVSSTITGVNRAAGETGAAAAQVLAAAGALAGQSDTLRRAVDDFLARIRAA